MDNWEILKNILYITGSILGIIGFYRTVKKRDNTVFTYRTRYGNEVYPFLFCIRGDAYNINISNGRKSIFVFRYPGSTNFSKLQESKLGTGSNDESSFFAVISQGEALCFNNDKFDLGSIIIHYEDQYSNKYKQYFSFDKVLKDRFNEQVKSQRYYTVSKRYRRFLWVWLPLGKNRNYGDKN